MQDPIEVLTIAERSTAVEFELAASQGSVWREIGVTGNIWQAGIVEDFECIVCRRHWGCRGASPRDGVIVVDTSPGWTYRPNRASACGATRDRRVWGNSGMAFSEGGSSKSR